MIFFIILLISLVVGAIRKREAEEYLQKKRRAAIRQRYPGGTTTYGLIVLADTSVPSTQLLESTMNDLWNMPTGTIATTRSGTDLLYSFQSAAYVLLTIRKKPVPIAEFRGIPPSQLLWENAANELRSNQAHIIIQVTSEELTTAQRCALFTFIAAAIALRSNCVAIYLPVQQLLFHPHAYIEAAIRAHTEVYFPVHLWVDIMAVGTPDNTLNTYTRGMELFGRKELEIHGSPGPMPLLQNIVIQVAHYAIVGETDLRNGEVLQLDEETSVTARASDSFLLGRNAVHKLEVE